MGKCLKVLPECPWVLNVPKTRTVFSQRSLLVVFLTFQGPPHSHVGCPTHGDISPDGTQTHPSVRRRERSLTVPRSLLPFPPPT